MLLKNTGNKIVNIGKDIILPGEQRTYPDELADSAALQMLIGFGFITAFDEPKESAVVHEEQPSDNEDEEEKKSVRSKRSARTSE